MIRKVFGVSGGQVWLWGREEAFVGTRPLLLILTGAFAQSEAFFRTPDVLPEADVLVGHFPGNHCPILDKPGVEAAAHAYDGALEILGQPVTICGSSLGALVALAMTSKLIRRLVLLEPPLLIGTGSPVRPPLRARLTGPANPALEDFLWTVFGIRRDYDDVRDYRALLGQLRVPAHVILGGAPAGATPLPSLVGTEERALLSRHPNVTIELAPHAGHNVPLEAERLLLVRLKEAAAA